MWFSTHKGLQYYTPFFRVVSGLQFWFGFVVCQCGCNYPAVTVRNATPYSATNCIVSFESCPNPPTFIIGPGETWKQPGPRGLCLVRRISAFLPRTALGPVVVTPYKSSGTSYAAFEISGSNRDYNVSRIRQVEDKPPADYVGPTEEQKNRGPEE